MDTTERDIAPEALGPPFPSRAVRLISYCGLGLCGIAFLSGFLQLVIGESFNAWFVGSRVILTSAGLILAGLAIALRPSIAQLALGSLAAFVAVWAYPPEWDSYRLLASILTTVGVVATIARSLSPGYQKAFLSIAVLVHFGGILAAVTGPLSPPWTQTMAWTYFYRPYLQFVYLNNAYHFYSPDPGPASLLWFCIKYTSGEPAWVVFPRRPEDMRDPLALTYYRRLSLTEQTNQFTTVNSTPTEELLRRRSISTNIRYHPDLPPLQQFRMPNDQIRFYILPGYVRQVARMHRQPDREIVSIKVYRAEHRILHPYHLSLGEDPYDPTTYLPFFYGEFDENGKQLNPNDPLLYWLIPIFYEPKVPGMPNRSLMSQPAPNFPKKDNYIIRNMVAEHAGSTPDLSRDRKEDRK